MKLNQGGPFSTCLPYQRIKILHDIKYLKLPDNFFVIATGSCDHDFIVNIFFKVNKFLH